MPTQMTPSAPKCVQSAEMNRPKTKELAGYHLPPEQKVGGSTPLGSCATLRFLFRRLRDGEGFNRHYNGLIVVSYDLQQFGHMALGVWVVYKRSECYESASFGVSLHHPMEHH